MLFRSEGTMSLVQEPNLLDPTFVMWRMGIIQ